MKRLNGFDSMLLYTESPNIPTHTLKIAIIDVSDYAGEFSFEVFREMLQSRLHLMEPMHYRLVEIPFKLHHPMWLEHSEVDLGAHLSQVQAPAPGGRRELDAIIGQIAATPLDRSRPLWEMCFVTGLEGDRVAVVAKVHHALADGVAAANLIARVLSPDASTDPQPQRAPTPMPRRGELLRAAGREHVRQIRKLPSLIRETTTGVSRLRRHLRGRRPNPQLARNFHAPSTFLNHVIPPGRRFASAAIGLADIKETSRELGVKINDLVLAMVAGAVRDLALRYDGQADEPMIAHVPSTLNADPQRVTGNEIAALNLSLPIHVADPLERVRLTTLATTQAKEESQLLGPSLEQSWVNYIPPISPPLFRWLARRGARNPMINLIVSNVPGPRERSGTDDAVVSEIYSVGPLVTAVAMNVTVWSYADALNVAVLTDDRTLKDPHEATDAIEHALIEIRKAAGLPEALARVQAAMP